MNTVLLALLLAVTQIQPVDEVNKPVVTDSSRGNEHVSSRWDIRYSEHPAVKIIRREGSRKDHLRDVEARMNAIDAFYNVAKNAAMPSFVLESIQHEYEHELMKHEGRILNETLHRLRWSENCESMQRREQEGNVTWPLIGYLCPHCGYVHAR